LKKLQPIKFKKVEEIGKFIKRARNLSKISPNDLLISAEGNTFYLKDILDFSDENVGTGKEIKFLTSNGEKSYKKLFTALIVSAGVTGMVRNKYFDDNYQIKILSRNINDYDYYFSAWSNSSSRDI
jgi:hypothetical protein